MASEPSISRLRAATPQSSVAIFTEYVAGGPVASLPANNPAGSLAFFNQALDTFREVDSVSGTIEAGSGLGPRFNSRSCAFCHAQPATGGSSPSVNPQVTDATADGARNTIPSFITAGGPVREARFPFFFDQFGNPDLNNPNGGVEIGRASCRERV